MVIWVADDGAEVAEGDVVVKFRGAEKVEKEISHLEERIKVYEDRVARAMGKGDEAKAKSAEAKVESKKQSIAEQKAELAKLTIAAPKAGTFTATAQRGRVKAEEELGTIEGTAINEATFELPEGVFKSGTVELVAGDGTTASCEVTKTEGQTITVQCSGAIPAGSEVTLNL